MLTYPVLTLSVFIPLPSLICWPPHHIPESQCRGDVPAHFGLGRQRQAARPKNPTHPPTQPLLWPLCKTELPTNSYFGKTELHTLDWNFCKQVTHARTRCKNLISDVQKLYSSLSIIRQLLEYYPSTWLAKIIRVRYTGTNSVVCGLDNGGIYWSGVTALLFFLLRTKQVFPQATR